MTLLKLKLNLVFLLFCCSISAQQVPYEIGIIDAEQEPRRSKTLLQISSAENGAYLIHDDFSDEYTLSFFDGVSYEDLYSFNQPVSIMGTSENGAFIRLETEVQREANVIFFSNQSQKLDTLSEEPLIFTKYHYFNNRLIVFTDADGALSFTEDGQVELIQENYTDCNCRPEYHQVDNRFIYRTAKEFIITDGTAEGTQLLFEQTGGGRLLITEEQIYYNISSKIYMFDLPSGELTELNRILPEQYEDMINLSNITPSPDGIFFTGYTPKTGIELFTFNSSSSTFNSLMEIVPGEASGLGSSIRPDVIILGNHLIFRKGPKYDSNEIWISDGTNQGTYPIYDLNEETPEPDWKMNGVLIASGEIMISVELESTGRSIILSFNPKHPEKGTTKVTSLERNYFLEDSPILNDRITIIGDYTSRILWSVGTGENDIFPLGKLELFNELIFSNDSILIYGSSTGSEKTLNITKGIKNDLTTLLPLKDGLTGPHDLGLSFTIKNQTYIYVYDPVYGEAIYEIDPINFQPQLILSLFQANYGANIGNIISFSDRILWESYRKGEQKSFVSKGDLASTVQIPFNDNFDYGLKTLGRINDKAYLNNPRLSEFGLIEFDLRTNTFQELSDYIIEESSQYVGAPVIVGKNIYYIRENYSLELRSILRSFISFNPEDKTVNTILTDTIPGNKIPTQSLLNLKTDGKFIFLETFQDGLVGPAGFNPTTKEIKHFGGLYFFNTTAYFFLVGQKLIINYSNEKLDEVTTMYDIPNDTFAKVDIPGLEFPDIRHRASIWYTINLDPSILIRHDDGQLYQIDKSTGAATILKDSGPIEIFKIHDRKAIFFSKQEHNLSWTIWETDGTLEGTKVLTQIPEEDQRFGIFKPHQFGKYITFFRLFDDYYDLWLYDTDTNLLQKIELPAEKQLHKPFFFASLDNRFFFIAIDSKLGEELHYLEITDLPLANGIVFEDSNANGILDETEQGIPNFPVYIQSEKLEKVFTNQDGVYQFFVKEGQDYTLELGEHQCYQATTAAFIEFSSENDTTQTYQFGVQNLSTTKSQRTFLQSGIIRCGFTVPFWLSVYNDGCQNFAGTVHLDLGENIKLINTSAPFDDSLQNKIGWNIAELAPGNTFRVKLELEMPDERFNEQIISIPVFTESLELRDTFYYEQQLRCAIDPNDKLVLPSRKEASNSNYTQIDEQILYTIRFQNTGSDTAFNVRIQDQLPASLDYNTFIPIASSHPYNCELDETGKAQFYFNEIELPDSNVNEVASHGFITFAIELMDSIPDFFKVNNEANIYFDFNAPVITNNIQSTIVSALDADSDGFNFYEECNDLNPNINPGVLEIPNNSIDENCDGIDLIVETENYIPAEILVYPNPCFTDLSIELDYANLLNLQITDARGVDVLSQTFMNIVDVDVSDWPAGLYLLKIYDQKNNASYVHTIIKQ